MSVILVSACLIGCECRYKGDNCTDKRILELAKENTLIPVCPEQLGGLATPRLPSERQGNRVVMKDGTDVTANYIKGAEQTLMIAKQLDIDFAILKAKSPSCGCGLIYDGSFSGTLISGKGVTAQLLADNGFSVFTEFNFFSE